MTRPSGRGGRQDRHLPLPQPPLQQRGKHPAPNGDAGRSHDSGKERKGDKGQKAPKRKYLDSYCINLTQRAREGKLDNLVGREQEIERVIQILNRRQKNNQHAI